MKEKRTRAPTGVRVSMAKRRRFIDVRTVDSGSSAKADLTLGAALLSLQSALESPGNLVKMQVLDHRAAEGGLRLGALSHAPR